MKIETNHINVLDLSNYEIDVIKKILKNTEVYKKINLRNVEELDNDSITDILKENKTIDKLFGSLLNKINENTNDGETVIVPGKILGIGNLDHTVTVVALNFSESASEKLKDKMTIRELFEKNPKIKDARILG